MKDAWAPRMISLFIVVMIVVVPSVANAQVPGRYLGNALPPQKMFTVGTWGGSSVISAVTKTYQLTDGKARVFGMSLYMPPTGPDPQVHIADQVSNATDIGPSLPSDKYFSAGTPTGVVLSATPVFSQKGSSTTTEPAKFIEFQRPIDIRNGLVLSVTNAFVQLYYSDDKNAVENR